MPSILAIIVVLFGSVSGMMLQAIAQQEKTYDLKLKLAQTELNARIDQLKATVEQDRADFEGLRESLEPKKKEP